MIRARIAILVSLVSYQQQQGMQRRNMSELAARKGTAPHEANLLNALNSRPSVLLKPLPLLIVRLFRQIHHGTYSGGGWVKSKNADPKGPAAQCFFAWISFSDRGGVKDPAFTWGK